jgi:uncharacterized protein (DUF433 family)
MSTVDYPHVELTQDGNVVIAGTKTKVIEVVMDRLAHHWDADEIQRQHPHLSLGQIHAALLYYYDHQAELDQQIDRTVQEARDFKASLGSPVVEQKLQRLGRP